MNRASAETLVRRAKAGDRAAFDQLLQDDRERLSAWIATRMGERVRRVADVDDLVQEAQLRAFQSLARFHWRGGDSFFRWLCVIARHLIWSASQKSLVRDIRLVAEPPGNGVSPSWSLRRQERLERLDDALGRLHPEEQEALWLSRAEGLKIREVARRLRRPEPTVKSLIARALRKLRKSLEESGSVRLPPKDPRTGGRSDGGE